MKNFKNYFILCCLFLIFSNSNAQIPSYLPTNGLVGWWPFNGNANDESGNGNHGTLSGLQSVNDRFGNSNSAYFFDSTGYITVPPNTEINNDIFSISFWMNKADGNLQFCPNIPYYQTHALMRGGTNNRGNWETAFTGSGSQTVFYFIFWDSNPYGLVQGQSALQYNTWQHIVFTMGIDSLKIYMNGNLVDSSISSNDNGGSTTPFLMGNFTPSQCYKSIIAFLDDVSLYDRELTQSEIYNIYNETPCLKPGFISLGTESSTLICPNDSVQIFVVNPLDTGLAFQWYRNNSEIPGAIYSNYYATDGSKYKVRVSSGPIAECQRVSGLIEPIITTGPPMTITPQSSTSICAGDSVLLTANVVSGYNYVWKRFGVIIPGATTSNFYAKQAGNYKVEIVNSGGCTSISSSITVSIVCRLAESNHSDLIIYPNPTSDNFTLRFNDIGDEVPQEVILKDTQGKEIERKILSSKNDVLFDTTILKMGAYTIRINFISGESVDRILNVMQ